MRLYSNHDRKAAITEPLLLFSLKPGFPAGLSLFPRPSIAVSYFTKTRVEIAVLDNSPCQIAVFGPQNGDLTRGIADFGYFNPYCGAPARTSRQGIAIGAVCLARPPDCTGGKPRRGRHRTPEPLRQADIPDLINIGVFSALYFALAADLIAKAGKLLQQDRHPHQLRGVREHQHRHIMNSRATFESSHAGRIGAYAAGADGMSRSKSAPAPAAVILDPRAKLYLMLLANMLLFFHADARAEALLTALFLTPLFLAGRWRMGLRLTACYAVLLGLGLWSDAATQDTAGLRAPRRPPALAPTPGYMSSGCFPWGFA